MGGCPVCPLLSQVQPVTISGNVSTLPKMSSLPPRIPRDQAARLPWSAILALFSLQHIRELERHLDLPIGTITRAWSTSPAARGLSAKVHLVLLKGIASQFTSGQELRSWLKKYWTVEWLEKSALTLDSLCEELDLTNQAPRFGAFPADYLPRDEEAILLDWLLNDKQVQGIWITGPGGTGKSTLALSLVRCHRVELSRRFDHLLWVDGAQSSYELGLRQVAEQLQLAETGNLEDALRRKASRSRFLVFLDTLHDSVELTRWRQLVGTLGKLVVTSRTRLSKPELRSDDTLRQVRLGGFSLAQSRTFLGQTDPAIDRLHEKTDGLPLALRILSGLLHELGCSSEELVRLLDHQAIETLAYPPELESRQASLHACFALTEQILAEKHPQATAYFHATGVFQTRTLLKSLLDEVAAVPTALEGDRLLGILLRYNLVECLTVHGERFVQLHPLLHEFAREKIGQETTRVERYGHAIEGWIDQAHHALNDGTQLPSLRFHQADLLRVFEHWAQHAEWQRILDSIQAALDLSLLHLVESPAGADLVTILQSYLPTKGNQEGLLLKATLLNAQAALQYTATDLKPILILHERARELLSSLQPGVGLETTYHAELAKALEGQARYLQQIGRPTDALAFLRSPEVAAALENSGNQDAQYLQASILTDLGEHAQALASLQSIQENYQQNPTSRFAQTYLLVEMADRQRALGQWEEAIRLYEAAFAEEQSPPYIRAEYGRSLVACLQERQEFERMDQVLETVEGLLEDNPAELFQKSLARAWQTHAETRQALGDRDGAAAFAHKAMLLAKKIGDDDRLENLQRLLEQLN